jgi:hypothetical protein
MSERITAYDADQDLCCLYNRSLTDNEIGFATTKLNMYEANALSNYCQRLFTDAFERGRQSLAAQVRAALPQDAKP